MVISVLMMCAGSLMIAIMPTYATIGAMAPVLSSLTQSAHSVRQVLTAYTAKALDLLVALAMERFNGTPNSGFIVNVGPTCFRFLLPRRYFRKPKRPVGSTRSHRNDGSTRSLGLLIRLTASAQRSCAVLIMPGAACAFKMRPAPGREA
jgi:hypothetical protein